MKIIADIKGVDVEVDYALLDGGDLADRFLEGCYFRISISNDDILAEATAETKAYLRQSYCDISMWERDAKNHVLNGDGFMMFEGHEAWIDFEEMDQKTEPSDAEI